MKVFGLIYATMFLVSAAQATEVCSAIVYSNETNVTCANSTGVKFSVPQNGNILDVIKAFEENGFQLRTSEGATHYFVNK